MIDDFENHINYDFLLSWVQSKGSYQNPSRGIMES